MEENSGIFEMDLSYLSSSAQDWVKYKWIRTSERGLRLPYMLGCSFGDSGVVDYPVHQFWENVGP